MTTLKNYLGSKGGSGVYQKIISWFPPHKIYVEAFLGSGKILLLKKPALINIGIDADTSVIYHWQDSGFTDHREGKYFFINKKFLESGYEFCHPTYPKEVLIYADPPYLMETRSGQHRYKHEMSMQDHKELLDYLDSLPYNVAISCYDNPLYQEKLKGWEKIHFKAMTRGGVRTETLYMNYELKELHETTYVGSNFTHRQRIKRLQERTVQRLGKLPSDERQAVIEAIYAKYPYPTKR